MSSAGNSASVRRGATTRSQGSLPRVASLPPSNARSRATVNSEVEPVAGPEELERALANQVPAPQDTAQGSSTQPQSLPGAQDRDVRPSATFHTAMPGNSPSMLEVNAKIDALEAEIRMMRTDLLVLRAQPKASDVINDVSQLRTD